jgi:FtsH-binding integral membrane protein
LKVNKSLVGQVILYSLGIGVISSIVGASFDIRALRIIGALGFIPLGLIIVLGVVGAFVGMLDEILPDFKGKDVLLIILGIGFLLIFSAFIFFEMGHVSNSSNCPTYRGFPTCE